MPTTDTATLPETTGLEFPARRKLSVKWAAIAAGALVAFLLLGRFAYNFFYFESTDDAYLRAHIHTVSGRIGGYVTDVLVVENQTVKKGDVLVKLDANDVEPAIREAQASAARVQKDLHRFRSVLQDEEAELTPSDRKILDEYQASASVNDAQLTRARLQFQYTNIVAPADGKIGRVAVETGDQIQTGQALMPLVEPNPWVDANFKESQVANLRLGQEAEVTVDAVPGVTFRGKVESIAPGSGALFSLLPPDNATGNFTKIVQRIPVRITLDRESIRGYEDRLVAGMSTEVKVRVR
jgi:membrane fusion protein (multidrug efflux system)